MVSSTPRKKIVATRFGDASVKRQIGLDRHFTLRQGFRESMMRFDDFFQLFVRATQYRQAGSVAFQHHANFQHGEVKRWQDVIAKSNIKLE